MTDNSVSTPFEPRRRRDELVRLVRRIQALMLEVGELRQRTSTGNELQAEERALEQLRWELAAVARRTAAALAAVLLTRPTRARLAALPTQHETSPPFEELAA